MNITSTIVQALLQLCARLKRVHAIALCFLERGGLVSLLIFPTSCLFPGFHNVASTIVCHILEDPHMLQAVMESEIWQDIVAALNQNISGRLSPHTFISNLALVISNLAWLSWRWFSVWSISCDSYWKRFWGKSMIGKYYLYL